ncbi:macrolide family glycosyltransferase [Actinacidiphila paucisporea]|uniref:dTDP-L-oleandrosyltransferase n=1 Tax=Actinacidiphila paucisporea TaxID=310782 RepID=A0A1M7QFH5_9ACTN|nr:macrolide family glycosyltransferase [Actinacidiphila paucisporea]SHN29364.1 dTDP-L-oleandrosyltransferase [Actinacidiphila paucisporea]
MPSRILVIDIPSNGHLFPKLAVVAELVGRGHHVTYVTIEDFAEKVRGTGAEVLAYASVDPLRSLAGGDVTPTEAFFRENVAILHAIEAHYGDERPDLIAYDEAAFQAGRILREVWGLPAVHLAPSFVSNAHYSYFERIFALAPDFRLTDPVEEISAFLEGYGLAEKVQDFLWTKREPDELTIVFIPRRLQPAHETFGDRFVFIGSSVGERSFLDGWQPSGDGLPVVLISLGTVNNQHLDFFRTAVEAFRDQPLHAVISVGDGVDPADLAPLPPNVEVHRWVRHLHVLEHAAAFVTHGGTGSLAEALHTGTPLVVVPQGVDILPYTERITELGLGTVLPPGEVTVDSLRAALLTVTQDQALAATVAGFRQHTHESGGPRRAADAIENYLTQEQR